MDCGGSNSIRGPILWVFPSTEWRVTDETYTAVGSCGPRRADLGRFTGAGRLHLRLRRRRHGAGNLQVTARHRAELHGRLPASGPYARPGPIHNRYRQPRNAHATVEANAAARTSALKVFCPTNSLRRLTTRRAAARAVDGRASFPIPLAKRSIAALAEPISRRAARDALPRAASSQLGENPRYRWGSKIL